MSSILSTMKGNLSFLCSVLTEMFKSAGSVLITVSRDVYYYLASIPACKT